MRYDYVTMTQGHQVTCFSICNFYLFVCCDVLKLEQIDKGKK